MKVFKHREEITSPYPNPYLQLKNRRGEGAKKAPTIHFKNKFTCLIIYLTKSASLLFNIPPLIDSSLNINKKDKILFTFSENNFVNAVFPNKS